MTTFRRFRTTSVEVDAVRIGVDGSVVIDGCTLYGDAGYWLVRDPQNDSLVMWSDSDFRERHEPVDDQALAYLRKHPGTPTENS